MKPINSSHYNNSFTMMLDEVASILSAEMVGKNIQVKGISADTRTIKGG